MKKRSFSPQKELIYVLKSKNLAQIATLVSVFFFLYHSTLANLSAGIGGHVLFMDERIVFDGVRRILHPESVAGLISALIDGGDQRYGRILFNLSALVSLIPEIVFGQEGQILATRMLGSILIAISAVFLAASLNTSHFVKFLSVGLLLFVPFSSYYTSMPKPEPLGLFTISLYFFLKKSESNRTKYTRFILIGCMVGTKIAFAPIAFALFLLEIRNLDSEKSLIRHSLIPSLLGFTFSVPTFSPFLLGLLILDFLLSKIQMNYGKINLLKISAIQLFFQFFIYWSLMHFAKLNPISNWLSWTVMGTTHPADSAKVNWTSWVDFYINDWSSSSYYSLFVTFFAFIYFIQLVSQKLNLKRDISKSPSETLLVFLGLISLVTIFLFVHRLWGMYLYIGTILFSFGLISSVLKNNEGTSFSRYLGKYSIQIILVFWVALSVVSFTKEISQISSRESSKVYKDQLKDFSSFSETISDFEKREIRVLYDPQLFVPVESSKLRIDRFWGPLGKMGDYDLIVLGKSHLPQFTENLSEKEILINHVADIELNCRAKPCYMVLDNLPSGGLILRNFNHTTSFNP